MELATKKRQPHIAEIASVHPHFTACVIRAYDTTDKPGAEAYYDHEREAIRAAVEEQWQKLYTGHALPFTTAYTVSAWFKFRKKGTDEKDDLREKVGLGPNGWHRHTGLF